LYRLKKGGPKVYTRAQLIKRGYPQYTKPDGSIDEEQEKKEANSIYLVFSIIQKNNVCWVEKELRDYSWDLNSIALKQTLALPYTKSLVWLLDRRRK
jgi:hypothetical protein